MRDTPVYAPADAATGTVPLKSKEFFKFYEPLILLLALNIEMRSTASYISPSEVCNVREPEQLFKAFVNKLALVCDSTKGGTTVTAIWVSEDAQGRVEYHLASNQRKKHELEAVAAFLRTLLQQVADADANGLLSTQLLLPILRFNRPRIDLYLDDLRQEAQKCLDQRIDLGQNEDLVVPGLQSLAQSFSAGRSSELSEPEFVDRYRDVVRRLGRLGRTPAWSHIDELGRDARSSDHKNCWSELRHMASRLTAYPQAVAFFIHAKAEWPRLFTSFTVTTVPSSRPIYMNTRQKSLTADSIVGRLTRRENEIALFRSFVKTLQMVQLDARIEREFTKETFRPLVHAEVLLLNEMEFGDDSCGGSSEGIAPGRFFQGWKYIGSSKSTCRLCHYYFEEHGSGVGHRATHGNLYDNWRLPDVRVASGLRALEGRDAMLKRMLTRVRKDAFDLVKRRAVPTHRSHDSVTSSARVTLEERWTTTSLAADEEEVAVDDVASVLGELGLDDGDGGVGDADEDEDDAGGASL